MTKELEIQFNYANAGPWKKFDDKHLPRSFDFDYKIQLDFNLESIEQIFDDIDYELFENGFPFI